MFPLMILTIDPMVRMKYRPLARSKTLTEVATARNPNAQKNTVSALTQAFSATIFANVNNARMLSMGKPHNGSCLKKWSRKKIRCKMKQERRITNLLKN